MTRGAFLGALNAGVYLCAHRRLGRPDYPLRADLAAGLFGAGYGSGSSARPGRFVKANACRGRGAGHFDWRISGTQALNAGCFPVLLSRFSPRRARACALSGWRDGKPSNQGAGLNPLYGFGYQTIWTVSAQLITQQRCA